LRSGAGAAGSASIRLAPDRLGRALGVEEGLGGTHRPEVGQQTTRWGWHGPLERLAVPRVVAGDLALGEAAEGEQREGDHGQGEEPEPDRHRDVAELDRAVEVGPADCADGLVEEAGDHVGKRGEDSADQAQGGEAADRLVRQAPAPELGTPVGHRSHARQQPGEEEVVGLRLLVHRADQVELVDRRQHADQASDETHEGCGDGEGERAARPGPATLQREATEPSTMTNGSTGSSAVMPYSTS
jgi:hypothetical protein